MNWVAAPGGKRYTSGPFMLVKQNTAAGAKRWKATVTRGETTWVVAQADYLAEAKRACETTSR